MKVRKRVHRRGRFLVTALAIIMSLSACNLLPGEDSAGNSVIAESAETQERVETGFVLTGPDSYDSADTPIVVDMDKDENTITFLNLEIGRRYTLSMDGTTKFYNKYGESISFNQIQKGDIVDITFLKSDKHLNTLTLSANAWSYGGIQRYEINTVRDEVTIGKEVYKLSENVQYLSDGRSIEEMDLHPTDILTFQGIDKEVLCIHVEKGHGYLRLANDENFIGGWIEIGQSQIQHITEDMLLTVPEGSYQVNISHNGNGGTKNVVINRNEETTLDIGDFKVAEPKYGTILFSVTPSATQLYIDGTEVDYSQPVSLEYGIHQLIARADGYKSITSYLRVGEESAGIDVVLDPVDSAEDSSDSSTESEETEESSTEADTVTDYYKIYIDAPEKVEVYLDGNYVGISPCSFKKTPGSHVITLRKSGYETRSYTIQVDEEEKDFSYSFVDLVPTDDTAVQASEETAASTQSATEAGATDGGESSASSVASESAVVTESSSASESGTAAESSATVQ